jgi:hypothetical protein
MLYAVTIEPLNTIAFVTDRPDGNPWEVEEGVELEVDPLFGTWTPDLGPLHEWALGRVPPRPLGTPPCGLRPQPPRIRGLGPGVAGVGAGGAPGRIPPASTICPT